ncbi:MAG: exodeoxyribonuclease VII large subunit, partial [Candidatus Phosphoribacter sp.]
RTRAVMTDPLALLTLHRRQIIALRARGRDRLVGRLEREGDRVVHLRAQVRAFSPQSTLDRGYAVVSHLDGRIVHDRAEVEADEVLRVLVAHGDFGARVLGALEAVVG